MTINGSGSDEEPMTKPAVPRTRDRLTNVEEGLELVRLSVQDLAQLVGTMVGAVTRLEGAVARLTRSETEHRDKLESVPDFVEEITQKRVVQVIEHNELDAWRKRRDWATKLIGAVLAGAILLYMGRYLK